MYGFVNISKKNLKLTENGHNCLDPKLINIDPVDHIKIQVVNRITVCRIDGICIGLNVK